ncbi:hypothetical protein HDE76_000782 [Rhodanobacter sp. ANJX3]|nr:hypothetical protein [Rhodanobacter sp. ANJX3]NYE27592.1 hypothetical protein [Rhodanobacter sp. K2T2]
MHGNIIDLDGGSTVRHEHYPSRGRKSLFTTSQYLASEDHEEALRSSTRTRR